MRTPSELLARIISQMHWLLDSRDLPDVDRAVLFAIESELLYYRELVQEAPHEVHVD